MADKKYKRKVIIALCVGMVGLVAMLIYTGVFNADISITERNKNLCDCFFTIGIGFIIYAGLISAAKAGTFNFFTYNSAILLSAVIPSYRKRERLPYYEYIVMKREKLKGVRTGYLYIIGLGYFVVSMVFLLLYYYI